MMEAADGTTDPQDQAGAIDALDGKRQPPDQAAETRIRELEQALGRKTLEAEILGEASRRRLG